MNVKMINHAVDPIAVNILKQAHVSVLERHNYTLVRWDTEQELRLIEAILEASEGYSEEVTQIVEVA